MMGIGFVVWIWRCGIDVEVEAEVDPKIQDG
jgi:hypothetical protein